MNAERPPKKSAMLEVRLPHETKQAFMRRCRALGLSASEVVRDQIERFLAATAPANNQEKAMQAPRYIQSMLAFVARPQAAALALAAALAVGLFATPSQATPDFRTIFNTLDADHDGSLSLEEFRASMQGENVRVHSFKVDNPSPEQEALVRQRQEPFMIPLGDLSAEGGLSGETPTAEALTTMSAESFAALDLNDDATVTFEEFEARNLAMLRASFATLDVNRDGRVSIEELAAGAPSALAGDAAQALSDGRGIVRRLDKDGDQVLSWEEYALGGESS